jgi:arginyl-tRNA synthetase
MLATEQLTTVIRDALARALSAGELGSLGSLPQSILVERSKQDFHGDLTCGVALQLASGAHLPPLVIANVLASYIQKSDLLIPNALIDLSVAPPGFLNFKLGSAWLSASLVEIHKLGDEFGRSKFGNNKKVSIEYPCRSFPCRNVIYGQSLANLFRWSGYEVCEEPDSTDYSGCDLLINISDAQSKLNNQNYQSNQSNQNNKKTRSNQKIGQGTDKLELILMQPARLRGVVLSGNTQSLVSAQKCTDLVDIAAAIELLNAIDDDFLRYFLVEAEPQNQIVLDLALSSQACLSNSAFFVRYAHARCCALLRQALEPRVNVRDRLVEPPLLSEAQFQEYLVGYKSNGDVFEDAFSINSEIFSHQKKLVMTLESFPAEISAALLKRQPGRIARFARRVADDLQKYYQVSRVITDNSARTRANLGLIMATRQVLANALAVIGVSAPTIM